MTPEKVQYGSKASVWASECVKCGESVATITESAVMNMEIAVCMRVKACTNPSCTESYEAIDGTARYYVTDGHYAQILTSEEEIDRTIEELHEVFEAQQAPVDEL